MMMFLTGIDVHWVSRVS